MADFPNNSNKMRQTSSLDQKKLPAETPKAKKAITGKATVKPKSEVKKFTDIFVAEDAGNVRDYVVDEVILPAIRNLLHDMVTEAADMMFGVKRRTGESRSSYRYGSYYRGGETSTRRDEPPFRSRRDFDVGEIVLETRADAEDVLAEMDDLLARYGEVTVTNLYDILGMDPSNYQANHYGWTSLRDAGVQHVHDGYLLKLPRPVPLAN